MGKKVIIVGAGLVGSLLAVYMRRRGHEVSVYERRSDMRTQSVGAGRSINLALSDRGIRALEEVGVMDRIRPIAIPMHGRQIHQADGTEIYQPYGKTGQYINSVSRGELNKTLMTVAEEKGARLYFQHRCKSVDWSANKIVFATGDGSECVVEADLIFAADGAFSATRLQYQLHHDRFQYQQSYIDFGYKELTIPADSSGGFLLAPNALHIWPRKNYMLIALPNPDGSFTGTLFFPFEGDPSFASLQTDADVMDFFRTNFPDAAEHIPDLLHQYRTNPTASLVTVKCFPWVHGVRFALIGDAAHAIVPFFGQGMNCGFEDCFVLNELMEKHDSDWMTILEQYQALRKPDGDAIAELALNNFLEMRDRVADPMFLLQKKIESKLHANNPDRWIPAYSQVTFSPQIRYSEALINSLRQEAIMQKVMARPDIEANWESEEIQSWILENLHKG
ncbi:MAG: FAD-dependent oxidoreductase [Bacteroidota bacterium]